MSTYRTAPQILHAAACYIVAPHKGAPTDYWQEGDPVIEESLGWYYWPDDGTHDPANRALSQYTAWAAGANVPDENNYRVGALLAIVTIPEDVRQTIEQECRLAFRRSPIHLARRPEP